MPENETPQPITREEFEAGVKFKNDGSAYNYELCGINKDPIICDKEDNYYCRVEQIDKHGFNVILFIFGNMVQLRVEFKNCFKL